MEQESAELSAMAVRLRRLAVAFGVISILGSVGWWWLADLQTIIGDNYGRMAITAPIEQQMRMAGFAIELIPLAVELWIVRLLYRFAGRIGTGQALATHLLYRQLGKAAILLGCAAVVAGTLDRLVLTLIGNSHLVSIGLAMSAGDFYLMLVGAILIATASVISRDQAVQRENDAFV